MSAADAAEVKGDVWVRCHEQHAIEAVVFQEPEQPSLAAVNKGKARGGLELFGNVERRAPAGLDGSETSGPRHPIRRDLAQRRASGLKKTHRDDLRPHAPKSHWCGLVRLRRTLEQMRALAKPNVRL